MKRRRADIIIQNLTPLLLGGIIFLQAPPLVAMPGNERGGTATERTVTAKEVSGRKSTADKVEVAVGHEFGVTLAANATTGYHWELAAPLDTAIVELVGNEYQAPRTDLLGAGGQEIWTFRAVTRGQTVIELKYVRPWEKDVPPVETASFTVIVQ